MNDEQLGQLLVDIAHINHKYSDKEFLKSLPGDVLSYTGVRLAAMKASIIDLKVDAQSKMFASEVAMDKARAVAYAKYKKTDGSTAAGELKHQDEDYIKAKKQFNKDKVMYEKLKGITTDAHDVVDSIKSRVIDMQGARKDERFH